MPTIGEQQQQQQQQQQKRSVSFSRSKSLYVRRRRDSGQPAAAETALGRVGQPGRIEKKKLVVVVPAASNGIPYHPSSCYRI